MSDSKDRILAVVDTNLIVSSIISSRGVPYQLIRSLYDDKFRIAIAGSIRDEYIDVLSRPFLMRFGGVTRDDIAAFLRFIDRHAFPVSPLAVDDLPLLVRDPKDNSLLAAALGGHTDYLITGDNDLLVLSDDPRIGRRGSFWTASGRSSGAGWRDCHPVVVCLLRECLE